MRNICHSNLLLAAICIICLFTGIVLPVSAVSDSGQNSNMLFAYYFPWYGDGKPQWYNWEITGAPQYHNPDTIKKNGQRDISSADYPLIGAYASNDEAVIRYHMKTARTSGIDGFMVESYGYGNSRYRDYAKTFQEMIKIAPEYGMKLFLCYETSAKTNPSLAGSILSRSEQVHGVYRDIRDLLRAFSSDSMYYKREGKPVLGIYEYNETAFEQSEWHEIRKMLLKDGFDPILIRNEGSGALSWTSDLEGFCSEFDAIFGFPVLDPSLEPANKPDRNAFDHITGRMNEQISAWSKAGTNARKRFGIAGIWPGFDNSGIGGWGVEGQRRIDPASGLCFDSCADSALSHDFGMVILNTWNDWGETTAIEASMKNGAFYLDKARLFSSKFHGVPCGSLNGTKDAIKEGLKKLSPKYKGSTAS